MHIHSAMSNQMLALIPTQGTQQSIAAKKAAVEVRRKLTNYAAAGNADAVSHVDAYAPGDHGRRKDPPQEEESFRDVFVSIQV
jgi:hypothetical protein